MNETERDEAYKYRKDYLCEHVPEDFANRISDLSNDIEDCIAKEDFAMTERLLHEGIEMIRNEITDDFCIAELAVFLIDSSKYCFRFGVLFFHFRYDSLSKEHRPVAR